MSTVNDVTAKAQQAIFDKLGINQQNKIGTWGQTNPGARGFPKIDDDATSKSRPFCSYASW